MQNVLVTFPGRPLRWQMITFMQLTINSSSKATLLSYSSFCSHTHIIQIPGKLSYSNFSSEFTNSAVSLT